MMIVAAMLAVTARCLMHREYRTFQVTLISHERPSKTVSALQPFNTRNYLFTAFSN